MKKTITLLAVLVSIPLAWAAQSPQTIPNNTLSIGKTGSADKTIEFNLTKAGASANPKIKWSNSNSKLQFSNDGTNYKNLGSGSGGSGGINLITENPDFESGYAVNWTDSASKVTDETSSPLYDSKSFKFTPTATGQYYTSAQYTVPVGMRGQPCLGTIKYSTSETTNKFKLQVIDGSSNLIAENSLDMTTKTENGYVPFTCPTSGTVALRVASTGSAVALTGDNAFLGGDFRLANLSQARDYGSVTWVGVSSCEWTRTGQTSLGDFSADSDCTTPVGSNVTGNASAPATKIPGITFASMPAGTYEFTATGYFTADQTRNCSFQFYDGTTYYPAGVFLAPNASGLSGSNYAGSASTLAARIPYTTAQSNVTMRLVATGVNNSTICSIKNDSAGYTDLKIWAKYFPSASEMGVRVDQLGWKVDANISGANPSLGTSSVTSYTGIENGSLTLTNNSGYNNISAQIPCSSTNAPSGTTCSSGSESVGVSFILPNAGDVLACVSFSYYADTGSGEVIPAFQIVETPNNAQTITQEGKSRISSQVDKGGGTFGRGSIPNRVCGNFTFSSSGQKTLRLFYEQFISGSVSTSQIWGDASSSVGQRDIHWEVYPINYLSGALPVFSKLAPTVQRFTSGSGTYTTPFGVAYIKVKMVGGGGGSNYGTGGSASGAGGTTTFGTSLLTANGGTGGGIGVAGNGGSVTVNSPATSVVQVTGGGGGAGQQLNQGIGGAGGNSAFGGGGTGGYGCSGSATDGAANTGGGAGGGACNNGVMGGGGGAGGYIEAIIRNPASSYSYSVGAGGTAGTSGQVGGTGVVIVEEYYQ